MKQDLITTFDLYENYKNPFIISLALLVLCFNELYRYCDITFTSHFDGKAGILPPAMEIDKSYQ